MSVLALAAAAFATLVFLVASAFASKEVVNYFGTASGSGSLGGELNQPRDIGVNRSGAGPANQGDIYVTNDNNHRIERFDSDGNFISAWGADVSLPDGGTDLELCTVAADCQAGANSGGNGTATGNGTLDNPQSLAVDNDTGHVYVSDRDNRRVDVYDGAGAWLRSFGWDVVASGTDNGAEFQVLRVDATGGTFTLSFGAGAPTTTGNIAYNASAASVQTELEGLGDISAGDVLVSGPDGGPWTIRFIGALGNADRALLVTDATNLTGGASTATATETVRGGLAANYEVCRAGTTDICKIGVATATPGTGQYDNGTTAGAWGIAVSPPDSSASNGSVFLANTGIERVNSYRLDGTMPANFGSATQFGANNPRNIAVDSRGIVYASNQNDSGRIERYDSRGVNGPVGFLAPILAENSTGGTGPLLGGSNSAGGNAATATSGLAVDPDNDGGGPDEDVLYVLRDPSSNFGSNTLVQQFGPVNDPGLTAQPAADDDKHGAGAGFTTVQGFGLDNVSGRLFVSATNNVSGAGSAHRVYVLDILPPDPVPVLNAITTKTTTTATFSGTIDPKGNLIRDCKFQYSTDQVIWTDITETDCVNLTPNGGAQAVRENVFNLTPATHYFVRLQVARLFVPGEINSSLRVFDTDVAVPIVSDVGAVGIQDTSARFAAKIDPRGSATGYVFEYGTTPALGSSTAPVNIGGGATPIVVSQVVRGLTPDEDYFFRAVATNLAGRTASPSATLHTRLNPLPLPDNRGYEQVSPVDKNGGDAYDGGGFQGDLYMSNDGEVAAFTVSGSFGDPGSLNMGRSGIYFTRRTASGWATARPVQPLSCAGSLGSDAIRIPQSFAFAPNLDHAVFSQREGGEDCPIDLLDPDAPVGGIARTTPYRTDLGDPASYDLLSPVAVNLAQFENALFRGASDDQSRIIISSTGAQTADAPATNNIAIQHLYEWDQLGAAGCTNVSPSYNPALDACLSLASIDPAGNPFTTNSLLAGTAQGASTDFGNGNTGAINSVSTSGDRIFFQNPTGTGNAACEKRDTCHVYMREGGAVTHDVSQSECTASCGSEAPDHFRLASPSGDAVLFTSAQRLTDGDTSSSGEDLFLYTHPADPIANPPDIDPNNLTTVSIDEEANDGTSAAVQGVVGASDDLETAFFVAGGQLIAGETLAAGPKLYRWQWNSGAPSLEYLAMLDAADERENWGSAINDGLRRERRVTPDGEALIIESAARINPAADHDSDVDVYRWTEEQGFECASCQLPGADSGGPSDTGETGFSPETSNMGVTHEMSTAISDDGKRIFFQTQDSLVPGDTNGPCVFDSTVGSYPCTDVYQWNDGALSLITPGDTAGETDVRLLAATPSGNDVFILTRQPLVGWDVDENADIYDARVGGGFPEPDAIGDVCEGEACRGAGSAPSDAPGAGSRAFVAPRRIPEGNTCNRFNKKAKRKLGAAKRAAKRGQAKRARALRKQARNLRRRAKRCNRRQGR